MPRTLKLLPTEILDEALDFNLYDEIGKLIPPSSGIWREISKRLSNQITPKHLWVMFHGNRYKLKNLYFEAKGLFIQEEIIEPKETEINTGDINNTSTESVAYDVDKYEEEILAEAFVKDATKNKLTEIQKIQAEALQECGVQGSRLNAYYLPNFAQDLLRICKHFVMWTGVLSSKYMATVTASSSYVESYFNDLKNSVLKNENLPIRADKFFVHHVRSIEGTDLDHLNEVENWKGKAAQKIKTNKYLQKCPGMTSIEGKPITISSKKLLLRNGSILPSLVINGMKIQLVAAITNLPPKVENSIGHYVAYCLRASIVFLALISTIESFASNTTCKSDEEYCYASKTCYHKSLICDGKKDCVDGLDENMELCEKENIKCDTNQFHCARGACIPLSAKCNRKWDCTDGSDEADCGIEHTKKCTNDWQVLCLSGECIRKDQICDGVKDCMDNSDETYTICSNIRCPSLTFQCNYGACVTLEAVCNGVPDCVDFSDELLPQCKKKLNVTEKMICGNNYFKCNTGLCIKSEKLCDGTRDCDDGSDETYRQCKHFQCGSQRRCYYGACARGRCVDWKMHRRRIFTDPIPQPRTNIRTKLFSITRPTSATSDSCIFPMQPKNGEAKTQDDIIPQHSTVARPWTVLVFSCNDGYSLNTESPVQVCLRGDWTLPYPRCLKNCAPLASENHEIECKYMGRIISCDKAIVGTIANIKCKEAFEVKNFVYQPYNGIECLKNGNWTNALFDCNPECGTIIPKAKALVVNGYTTTTNEFPWHVGIYRRNSLDDNNYEQICGGTLISETVIISAAHCFWNFNENRPSIDSQKYAIAAGKFYRKWNSSKDKYCQYGGLKKIVLPKRFRGEQNVFSNDIAILILNISIKFTSRIRPVCVDWSNQLQSTLLKPGAIGAVAGWGTTEEFGNAAEELQAIRMPYVDYDTCVSKLPEEFKPFITNDKICAGYNNGSSVCTGDSGGGLAFKKSDRYFIEGIVSVAPAKGSTCDSHKYVAFTSISKHLGLITKVERETH
ncbi:modular serine protease-like [Chrysoperla carnea]|uniref:modular serine protease-like n=1 Tax=Chrysoperla carnea TaxID=189513 RepID=UPI001D07CA73|nr:modular serine protease-like [Chrysoperla carnea]